MTNKKEKTLIIMSDNRTPTGDRILNSKYHTLAAIINYDYARRHGYDFRYVVTSDNLVDNPTQKSGDTTIELTSRSSWLQHWVDIIYIKLRRYKIVEQLGSYRIDRVYKRISKKLESGNTVKVNNNKPGALLNCKHKDHGYRGASWSKLPAIHEAMSESYSRIVYMDSDAFVSNYKLSIDDYLNNHKDTSKKMSLYVCYNFPWPEREANAGFLIFNNDDNAQDLVEHWWNYNAKSFHTQHDYEQSALNSYILKDPILKNRVAVINDITLLERKNQFFRHIAHTHSFLRIPRMREQLFKLGINNRKFRSMQKNLIENHTMYLNTIDSDILNEKLMSN